MKFRRGLGVALCGAALVVLSCSADQGSIPNDTSADASATAADSAMLPESTAAATRVAEVRARFHLPTRDAADEHSGLSPAAVARRAPATPLAALGAGVATRFEAATGSDATTHVRGVLPSEVLRRVPRRARVALPVQAAGEVKLEDETSHLAVAFALEHAQSARVEVAEGIALYRGALDGADVIHRVYAEGTEDFVVFEKRPAREELRYSVDVSRVPGLRLVSNTLEFLDDGGTPLLRVAPPYVVDAKGARHDAQLAVSGCAYDTSPAGPWGRKVTKPGAERCMVSVSWGGEVAYPAVVDPIWGATGSMATGRAAHTATLLASGRVLVTGGVASNLVSTAELFEPAGNAGAGMFAATGSMSTVRAYHAAAPLASGNVLVAGGVTGSVYSSTWVVKTAELYDAGAGTFVATGDMTASRQVFTATVLLTGKVLIAGGDDGRALYPIATAEIFDPAGNVGVGTFIATGSMSTARYAPAASVLPSGKVLVTGGRSFGLSVQATAEIFDPGAGGGAGAFEAPRAMTAARMSHSAAVLASGKVLVAGGSGTSTAELFDPAGSGGLGTFAATGSMSAARSSFSLSSLPSGKAVAAGGYPGLASTEVFDPVGNAGAGAFSISGPMSTNRYDHRAIVLPSAKVLIAGGRSSNSGPGANGMTSAELSDGGTGEVCGADTDCATEHCVDGVCCNSACSGGCDRCDVPGKVGTCTIMPSGDPGANAACAFPLACDGVNATCPVACASDAACAATYYCAPDGTCQTRKPQASACNTAAGADCKEAGCRECTSGFCVDGVCCDTACSDGLCQACAAALKQSGADDGTCGSSKDGIDPRDECAPSGGPCGPDGQCNGAGACRVLTPAGVSCGAGVCQGTVAKGQLCDGAGACAASGAAVECSPFLCSGGGCTTSCVTSADCAADGWCSAGKCEKRVAGGTGCTGNDQCTTGFCADGVCCNVACNGGGCDRCDLAGKEGTCTIAPAGNPGANAACASPLACDGVNAACPSSCASDAACAAAYYCAPNGTCQARKAQAAACNTAAGADCKGAGCRACTSGSCVDGFCCDTACNGTCQACAAAFKQSGVADGTCGPIKDGIDPRNECAPSGVLCGADGQCNGTGACRLTTPAGVSCGSGVCAGTVAKGELCNGAGVCTSSGPAVECAPFLCANGGCTTSCVTSADCAADGWCSAGKCEKRVSSGKACTTKDECASNICADGFCCNAPCSGQCEACDVAGAEGTCAPVSGKPHGGRAACAAGSATSPCAAAQCDGTERATCAGFVGSLVSCGQASCANATATSEGSCNGKGSCKTPDPVPCGAYGCGATACKTTCTGDGDCAPGNTCDGTTGKCVSGATCDGDHTTTGANGTTQDCTPYKCDSAGTCRTACSSVNDCVAPTVCDGSGKCALPPEDPAGDDGCSVVTTGAPDPGARIGWLAAIAGLALARRRRQRRGGSSASR